MQIDGNGSIPVRTEIRWAIIRPPITANPVQIECPKTPPTITPSTSSRAANIIVVSWDLSPHSAKNVIVNDCIRTRVIREAVTFDFGLRIVAVADVPFIVSAPSTIVTTPHSTSGNNVEPASFSNYFFLKSNKIKITHSSEYHRLSIYLIFTLL